MAVSSLPRTAVVVLNWNGLDWTRECLAALLAQQGVPFEVHVVDNGSQGGEADALQQEYGGRIVLHRLPQNLGFAGGCNAALATVLAGDSCSYTALLNNDAVAEPGWLQALVAAAEADPQIGICASRMVFHSEPGIVENAGVFVLSNGDAVPRGRHEPAVGYAEGCDLLAACGGAVLLRLQMLRSIGTFRPEFFANFEDLDLSLRAAATGWRTRYVPSAVVRHHLNVTIVRVRDRAFDVRSVRNATWAWLVNTPLPVIVLNLPWFVLCNVGIVLCMPLLGRPGVARAFLQGRFQAWRERGQLRAARAALRPLRRGSWLALWWRQRSWFLEYGRLLLQRLRGRRTTVLGR